MTACEPPLIAGGFTGEAPHDHHDQGREERHAENALATWLRSRNHRREIDPRCQEGGDHPEQSELEVPRSREVVGKNAGEVIPEKATGFSVVVRGRTAEQGLHTEQGGDDEKVPGGRALRRRQGYFGRRSESQSAFLFHVPAKER